MTKRRNSPIPSFKGYSFKPLEPQREEDLSSAAVDPLLQPEEQGTIKRYLRYADTLINSSGQNDEKTPADDQSVREASLLGARRSPDKDLPSAEPSNRDPGSSDSDKAKKAA
jgi:hypothetical protein